jgi:hypothetical protein
MGNNEASTPNRPAVSGTEPTAPPWPDINLTTEDIHIFPLKEM